MTISVDMKKSKKKTGDWNGWNRWTSFIKKKGNCLHSLLGDGYCVTYFTGKFPVEIVYKRTIFNMS